MSDQHNLQVILNSHFPIVVIETHEESRAVDLLKRIVTPTGKGLMFWSAAAGLKDHLPGDDHGLSLAAPASPVQLATADATLEPETMLEAVRSRTRNSVVALLDFHPYLDNPRIRRLIREIGQARHLNGITLVLISHRLDIPDEIQRLCARFELALPDSVALRRLIGEEAGIWRIKNKAASVKANEKALDLLVKNLRGVTLSDARRLIRNAIYNDGAITHSDISEVQQARYRLVDPEGILSYEYDTANPTELGGFDALKKWLELRRKPFMDSVAGSDIPRGIMILGVQGCGKSLAAKCVAGAWGIPLLRLDFGALYNKYIGETERNIRESLRSAELMAPCVLWIDEIEKGIQGGDGDNGTSQRILGTFLTWMAENRAQVFIVATANDISALPPELLRKGRLDEVFFVDLPTPATRAEILQIHLRNRALDPDSFDLQQIVQATEGYSGAEIEQVVVAARYAAGAGDETIATTHILAEIRQTRPLSVLMAEEIAQLRHWARQRTVPVQQENRE